MDNGQRPELGEIKVGDPVVISYFAGGRKRNTYAGEVVKAARVWITVRRTDYRGGHEYRFRRDTQRGIGALARQCEFVTPAQAEWDANAEASEARKFLREQGIQIQMGSPWDNHDRVTALADLLREAMK